MLEIRVLLLAIVSLSGLGFAQDAKSNATSSSSTSAPSQAHGSTPTYKDPNAPIESRVSDLLSRMTIEEKTAQLMQGDISNWVNTTLGVETFTFNYSGLVENMQTKAGQFYVGYPVPQQWIAEGVKLAQDYLLQNTTLGIPAIVQTEGIHGFLIGNATIFNSPIAQACSWNRSAIQAMAKAIAVEAAALGVTQLFAPLADLARELRYGRVEETYGEDSYLAGEMAYSYVVGLQSHNVSATVKHFAAYSMPEGGLNTGPVHGGERELRTTWLPSYKRAIIDAGAYGIMSAYSSYDGVPLVANSYIVTDILRGEWGYEYFVTSDSGATDRLCDAFLMCQSEPIDMAAVTMYALPAGTDVEMGGGSFNYRTVPDLVANGTLNESVVDTAVARQLRAKFALGLFEDPYRAVPANETALSIHTPEHIALARSLDAESIVLLENNNNILPLKRNVNVAVIGPMAAGYMNYGDYVVYESQFRGVWPLTGIQNASTGTVTYAQGCERWSTDQSGFDDAIATAKAADVAVVIVGTWSRDQVLLWESGPDGNATTGEHVDLQSLDLVGAMPHLVRAVFDTGVPTIVVYSSGKPITENWISVEAAALVQQFYPSEQGGNALADVLYGDVNPSGHLSVGFPDNVGALPIYYDYLNSGRTTSPGYAFPNGTLVFGHQYVFGTPVPTYPFGYGLSYSNFTYSSLSLSKSSAESSDTITVTVEVTNESDIDGAEVVQLYVKDVISSVVVPNMLLKGFEKVWVPAGQTVSVAIPLNVADLGLWNIQMQYVVEPGDFSIMVGRSSVDIRAQTTLTVA